MAYTWTNGELITADKLNNTGGYDLVILAEKNMEDISSISDFEIISGSIEGLAQKLADGAIVKAVTVLKYAYGGAIDTQFTYEMAVADLAYSYMRFVCWHDSNAFRALNLSFNSEYELTGYQFLQL